MRLYLLRHAEAEPPVTSDAERVLTRKGVEQATLAGGYCRRHGLRPALILTSPYRRTVQTAEILAAAIQNVPTQAATFLASGLEAETALEELAGFAQLASLMLVGHQPDLGLLAAALLGLREAGNLPFKVASLAGLQVDRLTAGGASLAFFVSLPQMQAR